MESSGIFLNLWPGVRVTPGAPIITLNSSYRTYLISRGIVDNPCEEPACLMVKNKMAPAVTVLRTSNLEKSFTSDLVA